MSQSHPLVSVVIPNWNGAHHLVTCLDALGRQTYPNFEVVLVDNGSTDRSVALVQERYPAVRLLVLPENQGFAGAVNAAIRDLAQGEIIALLNNDTEVHPDWLAALQDALTRYPQAGMAASKILLFDRRDTFHSAGDTFGVDGMPVNRGVWQRDVGQFDREELIFGGCGGAVAYRRAMLDEIGLFDRRLGSYCEDVDLNWRAQLAGWQCIYVPKAIVYHKVSATGGGPLSSYHVGRNVLWVLARDYPTALWRRHWPAILRRQGQVAVEALRAWRGAAARARLRGQMAGLWGMVSIWLHQRPAIQQTRRVSEEYLHALLES
ncbi:MAG: glycosyltransferase family 2 protein [Chloroflexi bacterium]|nr:glycosyltransferase family 2 protein [Chloroflexota bacterium]